MNTTPPSATNLFMPANFNHSKIFKYALAKMLLLFSTVTGLTVTNAIAQAPVISYTSPHTYALGTAITTLAPTASGVAKQAYSSTPHALGSGFSYTFGIAVDAAGNVYVADPGNNAIHEIPAGGGSAFAIGSGFNAPTGVAVDAAGNVYVADNQNNAIKEIPAGGGAIISIGSGFDDPHSIAVDAAGNLYFDDQAGTVIEEMPAGGGAPVILVSGFNQVEDLAVDADGNVYVADIARQTVYKVPAGGGAKVVISTGFSAPCGIAVDAADNIYVTDPSNSTLTEIPAGGGSPVTIASGLSYPEGAAIDSKGNVYAACFGVVDRFKPLGGYYISPFLPVGLSFDTNTGTISGTPTVANAATNYTVTAYNASGGKAAKVNITVKASSNALLSSLVLANPYAALTTVAGPDFRDYTATTTAATIAVAPVTSSPLAMVTVNGTTVASGSVSAPTALDMGPNTITTIVTAQDGSTKAFVVTVIRGPLTDDLLNSLVLTKPYAALTIASGPDFVDYTATTTASSIEVAPIANSSVATVTVNGTTVAPGSASGPIALNMGANIITTIVTAQDGISAKTFAITVTRTAAPLNTFNLQSGGTVENDAVTVHQGLSPNGDGINDFLTIDGITASPDNHLAITDRSGTLVYQVKGYDNSTKSFNGHSNINGRMQLPGTYYYALDYTANGVAKHKTGFIVLKY